MFVTTLAGFLADVELLDLPSGAPLLDELAAGPALRRAAARRALRWTRCRRVPPLGPAAARAGHGFRLQWVRRRQVALQVCLALAFLSRLQLFARSWIKKGYSLLLIVACHLLIKITAT